MLYLLATDSIRMKIEHGECLHNTFSNDMKKISGKCGLTCYYQKNRLVVEIKLLY